MTTAWQQVCDDFCAMIDWDRPELRRSPMAKSHREGQSALAAMEMVRHLRGRKKPTLGDTPAFVERLRDAASNAFSAQATAAVAKFQFDMALSPDFKFMCILASETWWVGGTAEHFERLRRSIVEGRAEWGKWYHQSIYRLFETVQALWPMRDCPDEIFVAALPWLKVVADGAWKMSRTWHEAILGTAGHNWWSFEFCGLLKVAMCFPEIKGVAKYAALFPEYLEREFKTTLAADGYSAEQSMSYHWCLSDALTCTAMLAKMNGWKLTPAIVRGLRTCAELPHKLVAPDGSSPAFGDYSGGDVISRIRDNAALFTMPEAKWIADHLSPANQQPASRAPFAGIQRASTKLSLVGGDRLPAYRRLRAKPPAQLDTALTRAGLYVIRQNWTPDADCVQIEAAPKGFVVNSHGHTSILNFILHARGTPVLIDSESSWEYDPSSRAKWWRVGSFSHNVATVDGEHQLPIRGMFRWQGQCTPVVDDWFSEKRYAYFHGVHEAYERLENKVTACRRKLFYLRGGYWILIDRFTASSNEHAHQYMQHFQVALPSKMSAEGRLVTKGPRGNLMIIPADPVATVAAIEPCPAPTKDYPNPDHLTYTLDTKGHGVMVKVMAPFTGNASQNVPRVKVRTIPITADDGRVLSPFEATALEIEFNGRRDVYVDLHMIWTMEWSAGGVTSSQRLFHSACAKGG